MNKDLWLNSEHSARAILSMDNYIQTMYKSVRHDNRGFITEYKLELRDDIAFLIIPLCYGFLKILTFKQD